VQLLRSAPETPAYAAHNPSLCNCWPGFEHRVANMATAWVASPVPAVVGRRACYRTRPRSAAISSGFSGFCLRPRRSACAEGPARYVDAHRTIGIHADRSG